MVGWGVSGFGAVLWDVLLAAHRFALGWGNHSLWDWVIHWVGSKVEVGGLSGKVCRKVFVEKTQTGT